MAPEAVGDWWMLNVDVAATLADGSPLLNEFVMTTAMLCHDSTKTANATMSERMTAVAENETLIANATTTENGMLIANATNEATVIHASAYRDETRSRRTDNGYFETTELVKLRLLSRRNIGVNFSNSCSYFSSYCGRNVDDAR
jgi:hypothetical protein